MKLRPIVIDSNQREPSEYMTDSFPLSFDEQQVADSRINAIRHRHGGIQISYVTKGRVLFRGDGTEALIGQGQALFINSCCLHEAVLLPDQTDSVYISVNFHPGLIYGQMDSSIYLDYVYPVLNSVDLAFIPLTGPSGWHRDFCALVEQLIALERRHEFGYELGQKCCISQMWQLLIQHNREKIETCRRISFENRIKIRKMVSCIQANHAEPLTLKDIADSIHISRSECCRLFRRVLDLTPFEYLIQYRISQSLMYLSSTDLCISDIAQQVGFGSSSYFTECFKREMGQSPVKYRKSLMTRMGETDRPS